MSGLKWGKIESYHNQGTAVDNTRSLAAAIIAALDHAANAGAGPIERIAGNFGRLDVSNGAAGYGAIGSGTPIGHDGFVVYRFKPVGSRTYSIYMLIQWGTSTYTLGARTTTIGSVPRVDPAKWLSASNATNVLGIAFAVALTSGGADASPWLGTTNNNGFDTKGTVLGTGPVWGAPGGGTLFVWPRSNSTGGTHATNKENLASLLDVQNAAGALPIRAHFVGDDDNLVLCFDAQNDATYSITRFVDMTLATGNAHPIHHMLMQDVNGSGVNAAGAFGSTTGNSTTEAGVPAWNGTAYDVRTLFQSFEVGILGSATFQPSNQQQSGGVTQLAYNAMNTIYYACNEATMYGLVGVAKDFAPLVYNINVHDKDAGLLNVAIGPLNTLGSYKFMIPWDGATTPASGTTPAGVNFRR